MDTKTKRKIAIVTTVFLLAGLYSDFQLMPVNYANAATAVDAVGPSAAGISCSACSSLSWSHTISGTNTLLTVGVAVGKTGDGALALSATYAGVAMTSAGVIHSGNSNDGFVQMFYLKAPASGTNTVQVTMTGGTGLIIGGSTSFTGVDQTTPVRNIVTNAGISTSATITVSSATGNMVVNAATTGCSFTSSGQTSSWMKNVNCNTGAGNGAQSRAAGAASVPMNYVVSSDSWGIVAMDVVAAGGGAPDTTPPAVSISSPSNGATVSGTGTTVSATASDDVGVVGVQFKLDGNNLGAEDTSSPYSIVWDTTSASNGSHSLTAVARDAASNSTTSSAVSVTVSNVADSTPPSIPANLSATAVSSSQINLSWTASTDNVGVSGYRIFRGGVQINTSAVNSYTDSGLSASTSYSYTVSAYDGAGNNSAQSSSASATTQAPPVAGQVIDPARRIDWSTAGVPGGIPNRTTICQTLNPGATAAQINTAIANCPAGQVVMLESGTYNSLGAITFAGHNNVTLRGRGANSTILNFSGGGTGCNGLGSHVCMIPSGTTDWNQDSPGTVANWTAGYTKDSTQITLSSVTGLAAGRLIVLDRIDPASDPVGDVWICSSTACTEQGTDIGRGTGASKRGQTEIHTVVSVAGNVVTITPPLLHPNWSSSQSPQAWWAGSAPATGMSVENMSLNYSSSTAQYGMQMQMCDGCWVKGIRSLNARNAHINLYLSSRVTIRDSYFYGSQAAASQSYGFEPWMGGNHLWENNIFQHQASPMVLSGASGVVAGYNYALDDYYCSGGCSGWFQASMYHHESGSSEILWEGNNVPGMTGDNIHGPGVFSTLFRNRIDGKDPLNSDNKTAQTVPVNLSARYRFFNIIGNVLGWAGYHNTYQVNTTTTGSQSCGAGGDTTIYRLGWAGNCNNVDGPGDPTVDDVMMRWGNYDTVNNTVRWLASEVPSAISKYANPVPANQNLPASLYLSSMPSFWSTPYGTPPWPAIGPDVTGGNIANVAGHANKIPAQLCFENMSNDPAFAANTVRTFNASTCYLAAAPDTQAPSTPTNLSATAVSSTQINLSWTASTDNVAVTGYKIFRGGVQIATSTTNSYSNSGLTASTLYSYTVSAYDAANNNSSQSSSASATTQAATALTGDINLDHIVNSIDYSVLNSNWFTNYAPADFNSDTLVNSLDWSLMNQNWLRTW